MPALNEHHQQNFRAANARVGLAPDDFMFTMDHPAFQKDVVVFGGDPTTSDIVGKVVAVASIAELKKLSGLPLSGEDDHILYPEELSKVLPARLGAENFTRDHLFHSDYAGVAENIRAAATAYILGQSEKVADYEPLINMAMFPGKVSVFAMQNLLVKAGQTVTLGDKSETLICNFQNVTVEQGGTIRVVGNVSLNCQVFTQLKTTNTPIKTLVFTTTTINPGPERPQAATGRQGAAGTNGEYKYNTGNCRFDCSQPPGNGGQGQEGATGITGVDGLKGFAGPVCPWIITEIVGELDISAAGGDGQGGGKGGKGGDGGPGGPPGILNPEHHDNIGTACNPANYGLQGVGGRGGQGGKGGDGGQGAQVIIYFRSISGCFNLHAGTGKGGDPGQGGGPGTGSGNRGDGSVGNRGSAGSLSGITLIPLLS